MDDLSISKTLRTAMLQKPGALLTLPLLLHLLQHGVQVRPIHGHLGVEGGLRPTQRVLHKQTHALWSLRVTI